MSRTGDHGKTQESAKPSSSAVFPKIQAKRAPRALREQLAKRLQDEKVQRANPYVIDPYAEERAARAKEKERVMLELVVTEEKERLRVLKERRTKALADKAAKEQASRSEAEIRTSTEVGTSETVSVPRAGTIRGSVAHDHPQGQAGAQT